MNKVVGLVAGCLAIIAIALGLLYWSSQPKWSPIVGAELSESVRSEVLGFLMERSQPYKLDEQSGAILVPEENLLTMRTELTRAGIQLSEPLGYELFDKAEYGMSEFTQNINYKRALESEISQTLRSLKEVKRAIVHLTLPKESIFKARQTVPEASIVITAVEGSVLTEDQIRGMQGLVAAAVSGLEQNKVTIVDERGFVLTGDTLAASAQSKRSQDRVESMVASKTESLLEALFPNKAFSIAVSMQLDFDSVRAVSEKLIPAKDGQGHLSYKRTDTSLKNPAKGTVTTGLNNSSSETKYLYSKERMEREHAQGTIKRMSVGIVTQQMLTAQAKEKVRSVVASGIGINFERGDQLTIISVPEAFDYSIEKLVSLDANTVSPEVNEQPALTPMEDSVTPVTTTVTAPTNISEMQFKNVFAQAPAFAWTVLAVLGVMILIIVGLIYLVFRSREPKLSSDEKQKIKQELEVWLASEREGTV